MLEFRASGGVCWHPYPALGGKALSQCELECPRWAGRGWAGGGLCTFSSGTHSGKQRIAPT